MMATGLGMSNYSNIFPVAAGGACAAAAAVVVFFPRLLPRLDFVAPWRNGKASKRLDLARTDYLGYATCAALPGNPWWTFVFPSASSKKFSAFGKRIFAQIEECDGLVGHFRVATPLKSEYIWITVWESKQGLNDFYKAASHGEAMKSYREGAKSGQDGGAPFNVRFACTGEEVQALMGPYSNAVRYWKVLRATVAGKLRGALLQA